MTVSKGEVRRHRLSFAIGIGCQTDFFLNMTVSKGKAPVSFHYRYIARRTSGNGGTKAQLLSGI
jgi:hypothetical protein